MEIHLDPLDDIPSAVPNKARAGGKFQPKAKPRTIKEPSTSIPGSQSLQAIENGCTENEDWHSYSCFEKSAGANVDIFLGFESLNDLLSPPESVMGKSCTEVDMSAKLGNNISASCSVTAEAGGGHPHSDYPSNGQVSDMRNAEEGLGIPVVYRVDCPFGIVDTVAVPTSPTLTAAQHTLSCRETAVSNHDGDFRMDNTMLETEFQEMDDFPSIETADISEVIIRSVGRNGKFQPKPKRQSDKKKHDANILSEDAVEAVSRSLDGGSKPALPPYDDIDLLSVGLSDSIPQLHVNEEPTNSKEISHSDYAIIGEQPKASTRSESGKMNAPVSDLCPKNQKASACCQEGEAGRSRRLCRKPTNAFELVDESENEALDDGDFQAERSGSSVVNGNDDEDEEYQMENEPQNNKVRRKSKKNAAEKEKPVRKRKKSSEVSDQSTKEPPKKFSHSTRRSIRRVDKVLLETPEDEVDFQKLSMRDLILLAEYKERALNKEVATTSETPLMNQSSGHSNGEQENPTVQESSTNFNYHSYMEKTPITRWSKQDTELFYEGVRQFGSDLSIIQQLFPARTRRQLKLKYKKEERHHRLRLHDALANRAKDHAHFKLVIERLQEIAAQEKHNSNIDDSVDLTSEDAVEEATVQTNEAAAAKSEQTEEGGVENVETDVPEVSSPVKSYDSEDDYYRWSQYKSGL